ncbi:hypothetical protein [Agitococcus lubricus]|uniref:DUF432 domain-containing protein n=1 Tax=Agitococcus lubricus TaxID=1077255 RepID=A0A2T5IWK9_9GAMM|nr:hypothetical protein [Agitococcus lubricus]PTQ88277.1 hypothetical protein C8N29_11344 [Agitococcus lubricus]
MSEHIWWGTYSFTTEQVRYWQLAGFELQVRRTAQEWHIESHRQSHQHEDEQSWHLQAQANILPSQAQLQRFLFNQTESELKLSPRMADRSVVVKPISPLLIPANQATTLFVSTPVWLVLSTANQQLLDIPVVRPTDTWFGASPIRGEICYATKVFGRIDLNQLPIRAFRAVTPVHIMNHSSQTMPIERINIPAPLLPIYSALDGRLWTPTLAVEQSNSTRTAKVRIDPRLHNHAGIVKLLNPARQENIENLSSLFEHFFE